MLNDAVAIVLYRALATFTVEPVTGASIAAAFGMFLIIFAGSVTIGVVTAMLASLLFKYTHFRTEPDMHFIETCLVIVFPYVLVPTLNPTKIRLNYLHLTYVPQQWQIWYFSVSGFRYALKKPCITTSSTDANWKL